MANQWERVDTKEFLRDVEKAKNELYRLQGHSWRSSKRLPWLICQTCGLVSLRNIRTRWCEKMGCLARQHPEYKKRVAS